MKEIFWTEDALEFAQSRIDSRQYILLPKIAEMIQSEHIKSILDYGCGEGYLFRSILDKSINTGLFDISNMMLKIASKNVKSSGFENILIYTDPEEIPSKSFDCVVLSLVLMTIGDEVEYSNVLSNCKKAMKKNGSLIIGITHPCFRQFLFSTYHTKYTLDNEFNYFENNVPFDVYLRTSKAEQLIEIKDFHQNLSYTFTKLKQAGLVVEDFIELEDKSIENSYFNQHYPPYLVIKCRNSEVNGEKLS